MCSAVSIGLLSSVDRFCFTWPATQYPYRSVASNAFDAGMCSVRLTLPPPPLDSLCARFTKYENVAMGEIWTTYFLASWRIPPLVLQKGGACVCGGVFVCDLLLQKVPSGWNAYHCKRAIIRAIGGPTIRYTHTPGFAIKIRPERCKHGRLWLFLGNSCGCLAAVFCAVPRYALCSKVCVCVLLSICRVCSF